MVHSNKLTTRFDEALVYAHRLHHDQMRKGGEIPYISHLLAVAAIVLENDGTEDEAIAALLHDSLEDQAERTSSAEISARFGNQVAAVVEGCSDGLDLVRNSTDWRQRKQAYVEHLRHAESSVRLVSAADKLHNARSLLADYRAIGEGLWARFNAPKEDQLWFYSELISALTDAGETRLLGELTRVVADLRKTSDELARKAASPK